MVKHLDPIQTKDGLNACKERQGGGAGLAQASLPQTSTFWVCLLPERGPGLQLVAAAGQSRCGESEGGLGGLSHFRDTSFLSAVPLTCLGLKSCHPTLPPSPLCPPLEATQPARGCLGKGMAEGKPGCSLCLAVRTLPHDLWEPQPQHVTCDLPRPLLEGVNSHSPF